MVKKSAGSNRPSKPPRLSTPEGTAAAAASSEAALSAEQTKAQQRLLNIFNDSFREVLGDDDFSIVLQKVKQALYNRDFEAAFSSEQHLEVYAARYSPPRALCYDRILSLIAGHLEQLSLADEGEDEVERGRASPTVDQEEDDDDDGHKDETGHDATLKMLGIGGGAAEIVAFGNYLHDAGTSVGGDLTLLDIGPWGEVVRTLHVGLTTPPPLSKYASAAAKASNAALVEPSARLKLTFERQDVLELNSEALSKLLGQTPLLVTMFFTLNELYTSGGVGKTTAFLRSLSAGIPSGSLLLVVDSPGSYSEAAVGKEAKKYPMQWLLDHTLLQPDKLPTEGCMWEKLESRNSVWFRLVDGLRYPIELEDMRYQMYLYRAIPNPNSGSSD
ncbi:hypothetical protein F4677DRAFT_204642 [Hypoxylon crocopeplum]|nr:hypothetical protein F4677DRAFT_204642 [Hypoxylon crocopeplum]